MTRSGLVQRLKDIRDGVPAKFEFNTINALIEDIEGEGVLDIQCPSDIAEQMNLPRPA